MLRPPGLKIAPSTIEAPPTKLKTCAEKSKGGKVGKFGWAKAAENESHW